jgi:hypothetical protein
MCRITVIIGDEPFEARFQDALAPDTCARFRGLLPWSERIVHARWSGEACWIPLADFRLGVGYENPTSHPRPGEFLFYPGGKSETEILLAYGSVRFGSKAGELAGNPFLTIVEKLDRLAEIGREILWGGARAITFAESIVAAHPRRGRDRAPVSSEREARSPRAGAHPACALADHPAPFAP